MGKMTMFACATALALLSSPLQTCPTWRWRTTSVGQPRPGRIGGLPSDLFQPIAPHRASCMTDPSVMHGAGV